VGACPPASRPGAQLFLVFSGFDDPDNTTEASALGFAETLSWIKLRAESGEDYLALVACVGARNAFERDVGWP
jgi:hypothetical protein